jgi:hypothetical protein
LHLRALDAHGDGQPFHQGPRTGHVRGGTAFGDLGRQPVDVVHQQRARGIAPADGERPLRPAHQHEGHGRGQQQEDHHHAQLDGVAQPPTGALVPAFGVHEALRRSASM